MHRISLEEITSLVEEVPAFPQTIMNIIQLTEEATCSAKEIEAEIMKDQGLTVKVLKMANSAFYSGRRKIETVADATVLLGFKAIQSMVLATVVGSYLEKELKGYALEEEALWRQSQLSAITTRLIAKKIKYVKPDQAYTAGLLKDIGKVILDIYVEKDILEILRKVEEKQESFVEAEQEVLGFHHGDIGARIAAKWNLSQDLIEVIRLHHHPEDAVVNKKLVMITHVADSMLMMMGQEIGVDGLSYQFSPVAMETLGIDEAFMMEIMSDVADKLENEDLFIS